jgi:hypothetical protein
MISKKYAFLGLLIAISVITAFLLFRNAPLDSLPASPPSTTSPTSTENNEQSIAEVIMGVEMTRFMEYLPRAKSLNLNAARTPLRWGQVEPEKGEFFFDDLDEIVDEAEKSGIKLLFTVRALSSWGTASVPGGDGPYLASSMPRDLEDWNEFLIAVVSRYKSRNVEISYEIENEVNALAFWTSTIDEYVELLEASYATIKATDPDAKILASSLACGVTADFRGEPATKISSFNKDLGKILDSKAFDVVSVHNYYFPDRDVNGVSFQSYLDNIFAQMAARDIEAEVWITEFGYVSKPTNVGSRTDPGSLENQAKWFEQAHSYAKSAGVKRLFWILLEDRNEPYFGSMGLLNDDGSMRPVAEIISRLP